MWSGGQTVDILEGDSRTNAGLLHEFAVSEPVMKTVHESLFAVTMLGLLIFGPSAVADESEDKAVQAITKAGGKFRHDENAIGKPVIGVIFDRTKVRGEDLIPLKELKSLKEFGVVATGVDDIALRSIQGLKSLESVLIIESGVTDEGIKNLAGLTRLRELRVSDTKITDAGLKDLGNLTRLERLHFSFVPISGTGLRHLKDMNKLRELLLFHCPITDAGLQEIPS
jgi:internalin A